MVGKRRAKGPAVKSRTAATRPPGAGKLGKDGKPQERRTAGQRVRRLPKWSLVTGLVLVLLGALSFVALYNVIEIPNPNKEFQTERTEIYYADGKTDLGSFAIQNRVPIPLQDMPETIKNAVVAAENQSFYTDEGIDPRGIIRAAFSNASGNSTQGASTITQQYVKILYLTQERSYTRKIKEAILSLKVQRKLSKQQVLEGYLNTIYFGRGAYGVETAAQAYFGKPADELKLRESAVLASVLNNPSGNDPANGKDARRRLKERYDYVLTSMGKLDMVDPAKAEKAMRKLPAFPEQEAESANGGQKGHVLKMVRDELERLGFSEQEIYGGGLQVTTTFTPKAMQAAEDGVIDARPEGFGDKELHVGVASVEPGTGAVRGMYAGQDYLDSQINWAVAGGQAGSTFKAFAVAAGIKEGFSLKDSFDGDSPYELDDGSTVENQGNTSYGRVSLTKATEDSINTAFIDLTLGMDDGPEKIVEMANAMGIPPAEARGRNAPGFPNRSPGLEANLGVALGSQTVSPINMANGYATIANGGVEMRPFIIEKVVDSDGQDRYEHQAAEGERAVSADIAADTSYALQQVVAGGSGYRAQQLGRPAAGKTGTATNDAGDVTSAWFAGYTPQLSTAVMYVRGKGTGQLKGWLPEYFGGSYPAQTWLEVMQAAMEGLPIEEFPEPVYVDGEAPSEGFEPYVPPPPAPPTTQQSKPTRKPSPTEQGPTTSPTDEPTTAPPTTAPPTTAPPTTAPPTTAPPSCPVLGCGSPSSSPSSTGGPSAGAGDGGGAGGGGGGNGRAAAAGRSTAYSTEP